MTDSERLESLEKRVSFLEKQNAALLTTLQRDFPRLSQMPAIVGNLIRQVAMRQAIRR